MQHLQHRVALAVALAAAGCFQAQGELWPGLPATNMPPALTVLDPASTFGAHVAVFPNAGVVCLAVARSPLCFVFAEPATRADGLQASLASR
jgi:hypothetical protein